MASCPRLKPISSTILAVFVDKTDFNPTLPSSCQRIVFASAAAGGPFFIAAAKNRIGRGSSLLPRPLQAGNFSLLLGKLVSDADVVVATPAAGGPFFFAATKNRIGHGPRSRYDHCRRNHSLLPHGKLESAAEVVAATVTVGGLFFFAATIIRIGRGKPLRLRILQAKPCIDSQVWP